MVLVEQYVGLLGEFTKLLVGRAGEKRGDVAYFVETTLQSSPCQGNSNPAEHLRQSWITDSCKHGTVMGLGIWYVVYDPVTRREY